MLLLLVVAVIVAVAVLAPVLSPLLLSVAVVALIIYQYYLLCQPLFLTFSYVSRCFTSVYPTTVFLRDRNGNKVTQLFCVIPAIVPYGEVFYQSFQSIFNELLMNLYLYTF